MGLDGLSEGISGLSTTQKIIGAVAVGSAVGLGVLAVSKIRKKKRKTAKTKKSKKRARKKRGVKHKVSRRGKSKKHKVGHRGTKQIHYTTKGQPYIILSSGKARFIKKSSAKARKKQKGGYY